MLVKELMTPDPISCTPETPLQKVAQLMLENNCGAIPVCEGRHCVGMVTDRDIVTRGFLRQIDPRIVPVSDVMTRNLQVVHDDESVERALQIMESEQVRRLPVTQGPTWPTTSRNGRRASSCGKSAPVPAGRSWACRTLEGLGIGIGDLGFGIGD